MIGAVTGHANGVLDAVRNPGYEWSAKSQQWPP